MKRQRCIHFNKLSVDIPEASNVAARKKLHRLRRLVGDSKKIANEIFDNVVKLRNVGLMGEPVVFTTVAANKTFLQEAFKRSGDVKFYEFTTFSGVTVLVVYIDGLVNKELLGHDVIGSLITKSKGLQANDLLDTNVLRKLIATVNVRETKKVSGIISDILNGNTVMFIDGVNTALVIDSKEWEKRAVAEPDIESVIRGPREGFIEDITTNIGLLRRKIKNPNLVFEYHSLGKQTRTKVAIAYIDGVVNQTVLAEVRRRLNKISTDSILETGYIEQFIEDSPFSPLATIANTQKPDILAGKILEGRVAIFCDGTPHVLTVPHLFIETLQTSEDYYARPFIASGWRIIRLSALFISILVPGLYVALQTFHQEMIPTVLLLRMAGSSSDIPFPAGAEVFIMLFFFELLRESGIRLPRAVGSAISIVGALIVGESAVNAGLVSGPVVIVTAVTGVAGFIVPALSEAISIYRLFFLIAGSVMGLYGVVCGLFVVITQAVSLRSFGVPYTSPIAPSDQAFLKDFIFRFPLWSMKKRPEAIAKKNEKRQE